MFRQAIDPRLWLGCVLAWALAPQAARAGGYDAFMWHSARHMGMAGAAVSYVSSPAAVFHNPAGLAPAGKAEVLVAPGLLRPRLHAAPARDVNVDVESMVAPYGMLGGAFRLTDWLTGGVALLPIAAAGGSYRYDGVVGEMTDETRAVVAELSPALAVQLPLGFRLGVGYRITGMYMRRYSKGAEADNPGIDMKLHGFDFRGLRVGMQWARRWRESAVDARALHLGLSYRHTVQLDLEGNGGWAVATRLKSAKMGFILPARAAAGVRGDVGRFSLTADLELRLDAQNDRTQVDVELDDGRAAALPNVFAWKNSFGLRSGVEFRALAEGQLPLRVGYAFDGATVSKAYPNAFAPPPTDMHMITCGVGYRAHPFQVNLAYSFRFGSTQVTEADVEDSELCAFCGHPGDYEVAVHGIYLDLSYTIEGT